MIASEKYVSASWRYGRIGEQSGHWLMLSATDKFNAVLLDYLKADVGAKPRTNSPPTLTQAFTVKATYETIPIPDSLRNDPCQTLHRLLRLAFASAEKAKPRGN